MSTEQEYDAQADMVDDQDPAESGPGPYPNNIPNNTNHNHNNHQILSPQQMSNSNQQQLGQNQGMQAYGSMTQLLDPYDPTMLDMDPFGLSASMQFPASFSFDTSSMR